MAEENSDHPPTQPPPVNPPPASGPARTDGRCDQCGYSLVGLQASGVCPECGSKYDEKTAHRLRPWPGAGMIVLRLAWPLIGLALVIASGQQVRSNLAEQLLMVLGCSFALAVPANSWFQVRSMLKRSLPERKRTRGPIFAMRAIGTTLCVLVFCALLFPFVFLVACLVEAINGSGGRQF